MNNAKKARAVGLNHVALEVGDIGEALAFYRRLFDFELRFSKISRVSPKIGKPSLRNSSSSSASTSARVSSNTGNIPM